MAAYFLLLALFVTSLVAKTNGSDIMSIISYDEKNNVKTELTNLLSQDELMPEFVYWMKKHRKAYSSPGEKRKRFEIFKDNLKYIIKQNASPGLTYKLGLNRFADITNKEYRDTYLNLGFGESNVSASDRYEPREGDNLPDSIDWRAKGAVGPIKDQGSCRSSWAFSAIASVEGINQIVTRDFISLSEQELVDCDTSGRNKGCHGGSTDIAFIFIKYNRGINSGENYPYNGRDGACDQKKRNVKVVTIDGYESPPSNNEKAVMKAVANQPVSTSLDASGRDFQLYESGVFNGDCGLTMNHDVNVVGYGYDFSYDTKYWIIRNSWGESWGEKGYMRLQRDIPSKYGRCSIALHPSYPIKTSQSPPTPSPRPSPSLSPSPSPLQPPSPHICDDTTSCQKNTTCCCKYEHRGICFTWGCCELENAICCKDHFGCCPQKFPVCNIYNASCQISKNNLLGVPMKHILAKPIHAYDKDEDKSSS